MEDVYLSLGSNLGNKTENMLKAIRGMEDNIGKVQSVSSVYTSDALGFEGESFHNMAVKVRSSLGVEVVLEKILQIEKSLGRTRSANGYSNRTIDIDIIAFGNWIVKSADLIIPHPRMDQRNFVLHPLEEIAPNWIYPNSQKSITELIHNSKDKIAVRCLA